jgi:bifunctional non-homologous end joining protein LigD
MEIIKYSRLFFKEGTSDKIYEIDLVKDSGGYLVNFRFGKRNTKLQNGTKTTTPIELNRAESIFEKLVNEKTSKGYTFDESGTPFTQDTLPIRTIFLPQLLNPIQEVQLSTYIENDRFVAQPKIDGIRVIVEVLDGQVKAYNRNGLMIKLPQSLIDEFTLFKENLVFDGELVKSTYNAFDLLYNNVDLRSFSLIERFNHLKQIFNDFRSLNILLVSLAEGHREKQDLLSKLRNENAEGIVFKNRESKYESGRPNSLGNQLKFKFITSASVIVVGINDKRSVSIGVMDKGKFVHTGNVTIPPNAPMPEVNDVIEVQYLYAFKESNALFQPVYLAERADLDIEDCSIEQLKYKADNLL